MPEWWPAVVFGGPTVIVSVTLAVVGIVGRKPIVLVVSAVLAAPFSFYSAGGIIGLQLSVLSFRLHCLPVLMQSGAVGHG